MFPRVALLATSLLGGTALATPPCVSAFGRDLVVPKNGSVNVPPNVTPFLADEEDARLFGENGDEVEVVIDEVFVVDGDGVDGTIHRLRPTAELVPGASYRLSDGDRDIATFLVGEERDELAPTLPRAAFQERFYDNCGTTQIDLEAFTAQGEPGELERTGAAFFAVAEAGDVSVSDGAEWSGAIASNESVLVNDAQNGDELRVAGVDLAGNVSEALVLDVVLPPSCASTPAAAPLIALLLLGIPRRRR